MVHHKMVLTREYQKRQFDRHHREQSALLKPGSYAYLSSEGLTMPWDKERKAKKLRTRYYGPFQILEQLGPVSYRLKIPEESRLHDVFHVALLKPASNFDPQETGHMVEQFPRPNEDQEYEVERILAKRADIHGDTFYLVKWQGYPFDDSTWEPEAHLANSTKLLEQFEDRKSRARYPTDEDSLADSMIKQTS